MTQLQLQVDTDVCSTGMITITIGIIGHYNVKISKKTNAVSYNLMYVCM